MSCLLLPILTYIQVLGPHYQPRNSGAVVHTQQVEALRCHPT